MEIGKKVAIFGKPGGGKSTLAKQLSQKVELALYPLDLIEYLPNGERISKEDYLRTHDELLAMDNWIIEGLGTLGSFWKRIDAADTLVYIDLPYRVHYWWVTKRFIISLFKKPEGWPEGSSVLKGTIAGWKYLKLSKNFWTSELFNQISERAEGKKIIRIQSVKQLNEFSRG